MAGQAGRRSEEDVQTAKVYSSPQQDTCAGKGRMGRGGEGGYKAERGMLGVQEVDMEMMSVCLMKLRQESNVRRKDAELNRVIDKI